MTEELRLPAATASRESHADWLELCALMSPRNEISRRDHIRDLRLSGSVDAVEEPADSDHEIEAEATIEAIADAAFADLDERARACGQAYPFEVSGNTVHCLQKREEFSYTFLVLLSWFGKDAGPGGVSGAELFEDLCAKALEEYLGGNHPHVETIPFGFPRRYLPGGFRPALDLLCSKLGEGIKHREEPLSADQKDAKLDIVGWKQFLDGRPGKLIAFGQCATGEDWQGKLSELPVPIDWCRLWMTEVPHVPPIRLFFVPHRIELDRWRMSSILGGILFDRLRIAQLTTPTGSTIERSYIKWSRHVLKLRAFK
jgi:hypothetical protein